MTAADRPVTLPQAFQRIARIGPDAVALRTFGETQILTWRDYACPGAPGGCRARRARCRSRRHGVADDGKSD